MPSASSSEDLKKFFAWLNIFFKDKGLLFGQCGFKGGDDIGKHVIDLDTGFWGNVPYSTSKPLRWIFHVNVAGGAASATHPEGYESIIIGHTNTGRANKAGIAIRIVPLLSSSHNLPWTKEDSFEIVALFIFPYAVAAGGAAETFEFDVSTGKMKYKDDPAQYVFGGLIGLRPAAESVNVAGSIVTYGQVLEAVAQAITVKPMGGSNSSPPVYNITDPGEFDALKQAVTNTFERGQAQELAGTKLLTKILTEENGDEDEDSADIPLLADVLPIAEDPDLIGIDPSVYQQINAALKSGKQHLMFYGPPGTGKTTLARWVATALAGSKWLLLTGSADWSSQDVIGGYQPLGGDRIAFLPGVLLQNFDRPLIIDELNRCDIDKVIGPLFTVLSGHQTSLPYRMDVGREDSPQYVILPVPKLIRAKYEFAPGDGWRLIATINSIDKASLYQMSYALARRFGWIYVDAPRDLEGFLRAFITRRDGAAPQSGACPLAEIWQAINNVRVIGPAPILDAANIISVLAPGASLFGEVTQALRSAVLNAFDMVMLPMLDGVTSQDANRIAEAVAASLKLSGNDRERVEARLASAAV